MHCNDFPVARSPREPLEPLCTIPKYRKLTNFACKTNKQTNEPSNWFAKKPKATIRLDSIGDFVFSTFADSHDLFALQIRYRFRFQSRNRPAHAHIGNWRMHDAARLSGRHGNWMFVRRWINKRWALKVYLHRYCLFVHFALWVDCMEIFGFFSSSRCQLW